MGPIDSTHAVRDGAAEARRLIALSSGVVDLERAEFQRAGSARSLQPTEVALLQYLIEREGSVISRDELLAEVFGYGTKTLTRTLDVTISRLRSKIERRSFRFEHLLTVWGTGYCLRSAGWGALGFTWRESALAELGANFSSGARVVNLVGPPGVGKTWLALAFGALHRGGYVAAGGSVRFFDFGSKREATEALIRASLVAERGKDRLIVLDGLEEMGWQIEGIIHRLTRRDSGLRVLAVSQETIEISGASTFSLGPFSPADAEAFLQEKAGDGAIGTQGSLASLAERLGGLPGGLELVAATLSTQSPEALLAELDLALLPDRPLEGVATTVCRLIAPSWNRLPPDVRVALADWSILEGRFSREVAAAVVRPGLWTPVDSLIAIACDRSLLARCGADGFYMLPPVRIVAARALGEQVACDEAKARLGDWFIQIAPRWAKSPSEAAAAEEAIHTLAGSSHPARAVELLLALRPCYRGRPEALAWAEQLRSLAASPDVPLASRAAVAFVYGEALGVAASGLEALASARALAERASAERLILQIDEVEVAARASSGEPAVVLHLIGEALPRARRLGDRARYALFLRAKSRALLEMERGDEAREAREQADALEGRGERFLLSG